MTPEATAEVMETVSAVNPMTSGDAALDVPTTETDMEAQKTLLVEAKEWFAETYARADVNTADYNSEDLHLLARLSMCSDPLPEGFPAMTYAEAAAKIAGDEFTYFEEDAGKDYSGCQDLTLEDECSRCGSTESVTIWFTTDRRLAAWLSLQNVAAGEITEASLDRDHKQRLSVAYYVSRTEAAYDEGEAYDDTGAAAYIEAQKKAHAEAQRIAEEAAARRLVAVHQRNREDVEKLRTIAPLRHPYVQKRIESFIAAFEKNPTPDESADT